MKASKKFKGVYINTLRDGDTSYYIGYTDNTTRTYKKLKIGLKSQGINEAYCHNKRADILNKIRLGENPLAKFSKSKKIVFDFFATEYFTFLKNTHRSPKSIKNEISRYNKHIKPYIGEKNAYTIEPENINDIYNIKHDENLSPTTVKHILQLIATIFNHAIKSDNFNGKNPVYSFKVKKIKLNNKRERYLEKFEVDILLHDERIVNNQLLCTFVKFALSTGARLSTILDIQRKDINLTSRAVTLKNLKTNSIYNGFLSQQLFPDLDFIKNLKPNDYVVSKTGLKTEQTRIQHPLKAILDDLFNKDLDLKDSKNRVVIHTLRHTFASILAINGTPIYNIQRLLDHKDHTMTQRYAKLAPNSGYAYVNSMF